MIKIAVVDNEVNEIKIIENHFNIFVSETNSSLWVKTFTSGEEFLQYTGCSFDLVCLDIDMPGQDGITIAKKLREQNKNIIIIFITNLAHMAIKGYEVQAFDFMLKPVNYYSFKLKIKTAFGLIRNNHTRYLYIKDTDGIKKIYTDNLYFIEVINHYVYFHTTKETYKAQTTLKEIEKEVKGLSFRKCNSCYLVNLKYVNTVTKDTVNVNGTWLKISRPKKKEFIQALANYIGGIRS